MKPTVTVCSAIVVRGGRAARYDRTMTHRTAAAVAALLLALNLAACSSTASTQPEATESPVVASLPSASPSEVPRAISIELIDSTPFFFTQNIDDKSCTVSSSDTPVTMTVRDGNNNIIAMHTLEANQLIGTMDRPNGTCTYEFSVSIPQTDFYQYELVTADGDKLDQATSVQDTSLTINVSSGS